ncbi:MAG: sugar ABC transporter permease [Bacilli bacterium]|nr:sugar ABC transporter permease [Bacilli bacterium]MDD7081025.1 sugar ABC transporter permease [bacterium]MDY3080614.1 sugar ABC transporter permease [Candidatus Enterosoma sp.]MCI6608763.1 sugar ABC transporter permease [Bacilli bacterium]MDY4549470.1 sugar ABC transporter permease [Candidatus Enterosoma sp.]
MERKNNWKAWLYLAPALILMALFTFFPLINTFIVSFMSDYRSYSLGRGTGFTFKNYGVVLGFVARDPSVGTLDKTFFSLTGPSALTNTLLITFVTVPISVILALVISLALNHIKPLKKFFQTIFFMPYVTNVIAVGMVFATLFQPAGIINKIFNLATKWVSPNGSTWGTCMFVLCLYIVWNALPYKILIFTSGLQGIDQQYYDAAKIDSTPKWKTDLHITLPLLSPQILYITVTSFIGAFKEYNAVIGLLNRNYSSSANVPDMYTVVYYIYDKLQKGGNQIQYASAAAVILFVIIMLITLVQMQVSKKKVVY